MAHSRFRLTLDALRGRPELGRLQRGIEKESLRVTADGALSREPHPPGLGSPLTHPRITTDFSEAQPELITGVHNSAAECIEQLTDVHRFVYRHLGDELLWCASMPCILGADEDIPVGQYGTANIARAKTVYRLGLGHRYGRLMQTISGIHYNFSLPETLWPVIARARGDADDDLPTRAYFEVIRNFRRTSWLLLYLFGASPAVCKSFVRDIEHNLESFDEGSLYLPHATSLRMGGLGYQSDAQSQLHISYNSLAEYSASMQQALTEPYPPYEAIGVKVDGVYRQLNTSLLQIENEFYGTIRPKRRVFSGERPIEALHARGVEYVEVRCIDLNPFLRVGIDAETARFLDVFLLHCLLTDSPPDSPDESATMNANQLATVERGRDPSLELIRNGASLALTDWAAELLDECQEIARAIDEVTGSDEHSYSVALQRRKVADPELTPSARMLASMRQQKLPFFRFAMAQSAAHKGYFEEYPLRATMLAKLEKIAAESLEQQAVIEAADNESFDEFLSHYLVLSVPAAETSLPGTPR